MVIIACFSSGTSRGPSSLLVSRNYRKKRKFTRAALVRDTGFAGVYFEKVLKGETAGIWVLNVQLASYGILIALTGVYVSDGDTSASDGEKGRGILFFVHISPRFNEVILVSIFAVREEGFFRGYTPIAFFAIGLQVGGGLGIMPLTPLVHLLPNHVTSFMENYGQTDTNHFCRLLAALSLLLL